MKNLNSFFYALVILLFTSCVSGRKVHFTQDIRNRLEAKNNDLTKLQYYAGGDIILAREISSDTAKIVKGEVVLQNGKYYETITLKRNTKGVCVAVYPNRLNVSFDANNNNFLPFVLAADNTYQILNNDVYGNNVSVIWYNGKQYILNYSGNIPNLLIKKSDVNNTDTDSKVMKGRKVN